MKKFHIAFLITRTPQSPSAELSCFTGEHGTGDFWQRTNAYKTQRATAKNYSQTPVLGGRDFNGCMAHLNSLPPAQARSTKLHSANPSPSPSPSSSYLA